MKTVDVPGGSFACFADGPEDGAPVICLHGFPDVPQTFAGLTPLFTGAGCRVFRPYLRGYAPSTLEGPFDLDRLGADVVELAEVLSPHRPCALVGHDWGAAAVYQALSIAPARFSRAVCLGLPHPAALAEAVLRSLDQARRLAYLAFFQLPVLPERALRRDDFAAVRRLLGRACSAITPEHEDDIVATLARSLPGPLGPYRAIFWPPQRALRRFVAMARRSRRIRVPTMTMLGARDLTVTLAAARGQEHQFAGSFRSEIVPDAGHWLHLDRPEAVGKASLEWLRG